MTNLIEQNRKINVAKKKEKKFRDNEKQKKYTTSTFFFDIPCNSTYTTFAKLFSIDW